MAQTLVSLNFRVQVARPERVSINGRAYYRVPLALINPGVLEGSKGALFYPPDECATNVFAWNGMPLTVYHPIAEDGQHVSANHPGILERQGIGFVDGATFNGKLRAYGYFDIERTRQVENKILEAMDRGIPIELSTGLFTDNEKAPLGANWKGRAYDYTARNYQPDHVAILPEGQIGACSVNDGCGVGVVNAQADECKDPKG